MSDEDTVIEGVDKYKLLKFFEKQRLSPTHLEAVESTVEVLLGRFRSDILTEVRRDAEEVREKMGRRIGAIEDSVTDLENNLRAEIMQAKHEAELREKRGQLSFIDKFSGWIIPALLTFLFGLALYVIQGKSSTP